MTDEVYSPEVYSPDLYSPDLYSPGSLVTARGREWFVLTGSTQDTLRLRPISGAEEDQTVIYLPLERDPVRPASFPTPDPRQLGGHDAALLLRDALLLSLRRGAGPFRSFGQIAVEPRAYQLVPLLMALKLDPIRLLIADDVGVGKTIEALLIARELLDRGEIDRTVVLCPPHLVEQWVTELEVRFNLQATAVTARSASRLESGLPQGVSIFSVYPHTVVSLDYIKTQERRDHFLHACPDFVIVDEAHTCVGTGQGRHQRHELLQALVASERRHLVLLTATPHSGDDAAFYRLLGLLEREYERLQSAVGPERERLRERLSRNMVQRRRPDIAEWKETGIFPRRETKEVIYDLTGAWDTFFKSVLDYCAEIVASDLGDSRRQRLNFWGTLALLRCASSSPMAAVLALRTRAGDTIGDDEREELLDRLFDGASDALSSDDVEPPAASDDPALVGLIQQAERLAGQSGDPKLKVATQQITGLIAEGFNPVVFCRFIATAHYVARHLQDRLPHVAVRVITGELPSDEREERVAQLGAIEGPRVLVATDCLSEGINLQGHFDAVLHYDLSWNPTRHEQREGRVDRFGQPSPVVRALLLYGANNPVDGAVLEVILRKAARIREELGVPVPVPDEGHSLTQALLKAVLLRRKGAPALEQAQQLTLFDAAWEDTSANLRKNRTVFAQRRFRPEEVLPEWHKSLAAIGSAQDVRRFTERALIRLGSGLEPLRRGFKAPTAALPEAVRERLASVGLSGTLRIDFSYPAPHPCQSVQRSHPLVATLAESLLERSLGDVGDAVARTETGVKSDAGDRSDPSVLGRVGCWISADVKVRTLVCLMRLRHQLVARHGRRETTLLVEEATALAWIGAQGQDRLTGPDALALLALPPADDALAHVREREVNRALKWLEERSADLETFAAQRAEELLQDHLRVRDASQVRAGSTSIQALPRQDVIGVFVLLPKVG